MRETQAGPSYQAFVCLARKSSALRASPINLRIGLRPLRTIEPLIAIVLGGVCGSDPPTPPAIAALLGRFLPRLGLLVATQAAFLFLCTPHRFRVLWGTGTVPGHKFRAMREFANTTRAVGQSPRFGARPREDPDDPLRRVAIPRRSRASVTHHRRDKGPKRAGLARLWVGVLAHHF
jgi:hypothetical protein